MGVHWKDWCWSWNSNTLATWCKELTHWKRPWCGEWLGAGEEGADRGWDGWMASPSQWTWVWVNSGSWWWTGRPGVLRFMGSQRVGHDWATELSWTERSHNTTSHNITRITTQSSPWPKGYLMMCMCSATSNLSCYITMKSYCLQNMWQEGNRACLAPFC